MKHQAVFWDTLSINFVAPGTSIVNKLVFVWQTEMVSVPWTQYIL